MFLLGHAGLTVALAEALRRRAPWLAAVDYRWVAFGALLPDALDKPLGHLILQMGNGRLWGHTLLACLLLWSLWTWASRARGALSPAALVAGALALGTTTHLAFDAMWNIPHVLLWPLHGVAMPHGDFQPGQWWDALLHDPFVQVTETGGLAACVWVAWRLHARGELARYLPGLPRRAPAPAAAEEEAPRLRN